jgi:acetyltransferase-like isoleucine patch superfamily enzyme
LSQLFRSEYCTEEELARVGFKVYGKNVKIAKNSAIIGVENIVIGDHVRIDGFCNIIATGEGYLHLGSYIHIGSFCHLSAVQGIVMEDFAGLSQHSIIYSNNDDYSGNYLTGPTVPQKYTGGTSGEVRLKRHVVVGSGCVILPGVTIGEGSSVGALSLINKNLDAWGVYAGSPAKYIKARSKRVLELEKQLLAEIEGQGSPGC